MNLQFHSTKPASSKRDIPVPPYSKQLQALGFFTWTILVDEQHPVAKTILVTSMRNLALADGKPGEVLFFMSLTGDGELSQKSLGSMTAVLLKFIGTGDPPSMTVIGVKKYQPDKKQLPTRESIVQLLLEEYRVEHKRRYRVAQPALRQRRGQRTEGSATDDQARLTPHTDARRDTPRQRSADGSKNRTSRA